MGDPGRPDALVATGRLWAASHGPSGEFGLQARDAVYVVRRVFLASLRAEHLQRITLEGTRPVRIERWWTGRYGRLRAMAVSPDGALYFGTSNRDGRGRDFDGGDFIYRIRPSGQ